MSPKTISRPRLPTRTLLMLVCLGIGLNLLPACSDKQSEPKTTRKPSTSAVYTTFYPTAYFAQRIAGDSVEVVNPCPPDADPAFWMPDESMIAAYQTAALIIINGASFEKWIEKTNLPASRIVDTTKPLADEFIVMEGTVTHTHGPAGEHSHEGIDGHTWLDPINAKTQAEQIKKALIKRFPDQRKAFEEGYAALAKDLDALDARHKALAEKLRERLLLCAHPAYNYVGRRYGWKLKSFHLDPEEMPSEATFKEIKESLASRPAKYMLWEARPTEDIAAKMQAELGLTSVVFSPCEALDAAALKKGKDFLAVMNRNIDRLEAALGS